MRILVVVDTETLPAELAGAMHVKLVEARQSISRSRADWPETFKLGPDGLRSALYSLGSRCTELVTSAVARFDRAAAVRRAATALSSEFMRLNGLALDAQTMYDVAGLVVDAVINQPKE